MIIYVILWLIFLAGIYTIRWQYRRLSQIKYTADKCYHDINSSLVIAKLAIENLKDKSVVDTQSEHNDLVNILEESIQQIELGFRHWDSCIQ
jgi:hypothetical protein